MQLSGKYATLPKWVALTILLVSIIGFALYQTISFKSAALLVESSPEATVYLNGEEKGKTPLELEIKEQEVTLHLVAKGTPNPPFGAKVKLTEGVKTIVRRSFGDSEAVSSGHIVSFEKKVGSEASLSIVSTPDGDVFLNGQKQGTTPLEFSLPLGEYTIELSSDGYESESFQVIAAYGYTTTVIVDLAAKQ